MPTEVLIQEKTKITFFEWSPCFWYVIWKYIWHILSGIPSDILSAIYSDILSGTCSDILSGILSGIYSDIFSGIHSGILSGIYSDILFDIFFWHSIWHSLWVWLRSGSAQWHLAPAVQVRQRPLGSGARGWGSVVPIEIWHSRFKSGSARGEGRTRRRQQLW